MARLLDPELEQYAYIVDEKDNLDVMCHFLYQSWTHIKLSEAYGVESAFEHPVFKNEFDPDEVKNWEEEANIAEAYCMGYVETISDAGKNSLLRFATSFLDYFDQAPDIFAHIGIIDDFLRAYGLGLDHIGYEEVEDVTDWEL